VWEEPSAEAAAEETADEAGDEDGFGSFEEPKAKPATVPYTRLSKVIAERNSLRDELSEAELSLATINGKLAQLSKVEEAVAEKYRGNVDLLKYDATFMDIFEAQAKVDPTLAAAAAKVRAAMNGNPMTEKPVNAPAEQPAAPATDPAVQRILERDARNTIKSVLAEKGVKPVFAEAVARDVLANVDPTDLADVDEATVVELAKVYFQETGAVPAEYLVPKQGAASPKPATTGKARPATTPAAEAAAPGDDAPKFKSREEFDAARNKRFVALAREAFGE
jgi:hypothetical protein